MSSDSTVYAWPAGRPWSERWWRRLAWRLPAPLAFWCALRVIAHATSGVYADQAVQELLAMDAVKRWENPKGGDRHHGTGRLVDVR